MLRPNRVKQALKRNQPVVGTLLNEVRSPGFIWMLANAGFDFVFIDMEHGTYDLSTVADMIKVARLADIVPLVRIPDLAYHLVSTTLDAGAMGLMLPRVETRVQVQQFISYMRYPPLGVRGATTMLGHTDYQTVDPFALADHLNDQTLAVIQIERSMAVANIDEVITVPGVDVALVGPLDLAISLRADATNTLDLDGAIQRVIAAGHKHGVATGIYGAEPTAVLPWQQRGMTMLLCNSDLGFFNNGAQQTVTALRAGMSESV